MGLEIFYNCLKYLYCAFSESMNKPFLCTSPMLQVRILIHFTLKSSHTARYHSPNNMAMDMAAESLNDFTNYTSIKSRSTHSLDTNITSPTLNTENDKWIF
jgi:hypothetical protein